MVRVEGIHFTENLAAGVVLCVRAGTRRTLNRTIRAGRFVPGASSMVPLPTCLIPDLFELERAPPPEPASFFAAALDTAAPLASGSRAAAEVLRFAAREGLDAEGLGQTLRACGLSEATAALFTSYWAGQPSRAILQRPPPPTLVDMDWTFAVSASSSEHMAMGSTFVQLRLHMQGAGGPEYVFVELDLASFYKLLHDLELAKARLEVV